jgi:hypothetical protein
VGQRELNEAIHRILTSAAMLGANHEDACRACGAKGSQRARLVSWMRKTQETGYARLPKRSDPMDET